MGAAPCYPGRGSRHLLSGTHHPAPGAIPQQPPPRTTRPQPRRWPLFPPPDAIVVSGHHPLACARPLARRRWLPQLAPPHVPGRRRLSRALCVAFGLPPHLIFCHQSPAPVLSGGRRCSPSAASAADARSTPAGAHCPTCGRYRLSLLHSRPPASYGRGRQPPPSGRRRFFRQQRPPSATNPDSRRQLLPPAACSHRCRRPTPIG